MSPQMTAKVYAVAEPIVNRCCNFRSDVYNLIGLAGGEVITKNPYRVLGLGLCIGGSLFASASHFIVGSEALTSVGISTAILGFTCIALANTRPYVSPGGKGTRRRRDPTPLLLFLASSAVATLAITLLLSILSLLLTSTFAMVYLGLLAGVIIHLLPPRPALSAYSKERVKLTSPLLQSRALVVESLRVAREMATGVDPVKYLKPPDVARLRADIHRLQSVDTEAAGRLARLLRLKYRNLERSARINPANLALSRALATVGEQCGVLVISCRNHDSEALAFDGFNLASSGNTVLSLDPGRLERHGDSLVPLPSFVTNGPGQN